MPAGHYTLKISESFSAGHHLRHFQGKCEAPHGHNFLVDIEVAGQDLEPNTELLLDFGVLRRELKTALAGLDHQDLNQTAPFDRLNPSSENIAQFIFVEMQKRLLDLTGQRVRLTSVAVSEKPGQTASYRED